MLSDLIREWEACAAEEQDQFRKLIKKPPPRRNRVHASSNDRGDEVTTIPLVMGGSFTVREPYVCELEETFPAVDVRACLKRIKLWNEDNPDKQKTAGGIRRHITIWLGREQDRGGRFAQRSAVLNEDVDEFEEIMKRGDVVRDDFPGI